MYPKKIFVFDTMKNFLCQNISQLFKNILDHEKSQLLSSNVYMKKVNNLIANCFNDFQIQTFKKKEVSEPTVFLISTSSKLV